MNLEKNQKVLDMTNFPGEVGEILKVSKKYDEIKYRVAFGDKIAYYDSNFTLLKKSLKPSLKELEGGCVVPIFVRGADPKLHYEFTGESKEFESCTVWRIRATKDLPEHNVKAGDLGGWVECDRNLRENAWVSDEAIVCRKSSVRGNSLVSGNAVITDESNIVGSAKVYGKARIIDSNITDNSEVYGNADVRSSSLYKNSKVYGAATVENTRMEGDCELYENANIYNCSINDNAKVYGFCSLMGVFLRDNSTVIGLEGSTIKGAYFSGNALIKSDKDFMHIQGITKKLKRITIFKTGEGLCFNCGDFDGKFSDIVEIFRKNKIHGDCANIIKSLVNENFYLK